MFEELFNKITKEMNNFENSFKHQLPSYVYDQAYEINFYKAWSFFIQENLCFSSPQDVDRSTIVWLTSKEKPIEYLYVAWLNCDEAFSEKYDDMLYFLRTIYREREDFDDQYNQTR